MAAAPPNAFLVVVSGKALAGKASLVGASRQWVPP